MSISLPTYTRRETPLLGRSRRVAAIITASLRRQFRRPAAIVTIALGTLVTTGTSVAFAFLAPLFLQGQPLDLSFFYLPASNPFVLLFVTLMAAVVGAGLIADDLNSMALTLYLSRPITQADYLMAKTTILGPLVSMIAVLPLVVTPLTVALLGLFPWDIALQALALSLGVGLVLTAFYTTITLFLSSLTSRRAYAAAGVFAITFGLGLPAELLSGAIGEPSLLYLSPWQNFLAVARAVYGFAQAPIDWPPALAILLGATVLAWILTYVRMKAMEVVAG